MPDWLSIHEPILVNTIGHCAGAVLFGMLLYFFLVNWRRDRGRAGQAARAGRRAGLPVEHRLAGCPGTLGGKAGSAPDVIVAASFSVLSLLPAVLLHISLANRVPASIPADLADSAGMFSASAPSLLHIGDLVTRSAGPAFRGAAPGDHRVRQLTAISVLFELRQKNRAATSRLAGAMVLFLFAISFAHFGSEQAHQAWSKEIALHHAGIPLALFVLLQNYRFLLLDAFLRFVVNATLAAAAVLASIRIVESTRLRLAAERILSTPDCCLSARACC